MSERLAAARRLTVKIGSALLVDPDTGTLKAEWLQSLSDDLAGFRKRGTEVLIGRGLELQRHHACLLLAFPGRRRTSG